MTMLIPQSTMPRREPTLYRFSVAEYHRMIEAGVFVNRGRVELLEGIVVRKMTHNPPHSTSLQRTWKRILAVLPQGWELRIQQPITLSDSEPEPDVCIVRGSDADYAAKHPGPAEVGLLVEVADSSLASDQIDKARIYAREGIETYWVVNLVDRWVEVRAAPSGSTVNPAYGRLQTFGPGDRVPLVLDGVQVGLIAVDDLLP